MPLERALDAEVSAAFVTPEGVVTQMLSLVAIEVRPLRKLFLAHFAGVRKVAGVDALVAYESALVTERLLADCTVVWFFTAVDTQVARQVDGSQEVFS